MSEYVTFLITILYKYDQTLLMYSLKVKRKALHGDCIESPLKPENRKQLECLVPLEIQRLGGIVNVQQIYDAILINENYGRPANQKNNNETKLFSRHKIS